MRFFHSQNIYYFFVQFFTRELTNSLTSRATPGFNNDGHNHFLSLWHVLWCDVLWCDVSSLSPDPGLAVKVSDWKPGLSGTDDALGCQSSPRAVLIWSRRDAAPAFWSIQCPPGPVKYPPEDVWLSHSNWTYTWDTSWTNHSDSNCLLFEIKYKY